MKLLAAHPSDQDLALFAGGELGPFSRWRIERHLESCAQCQAEAAGYFHLADDLSGLAEVPEIDWKALAHNIRVAAAQTPEGSNAAHQPASAAKAWGWKGSAVLASAACLLLLLRVFPEQPAAKESMLAEARREAAAVGELRQAAPPPEESVVRELLSADQADSRARAAASARADGAKAEVVDALEKTSQSDAGAAGDSEFADTVPPALASGRRAQARLSATRSNIAQLSPEAFPAIASASAGEYREAALSEASWHSGDAQITSDGRLSVRSFDAGSGLMTITSYYAP